MTLPRVICQPGADQPAGPAAGFSPTRMMDVELATPLPSLPWDGRCRQVWVTARLYTEPIGGCLIQLGSGGLTPSQLGALVWAEVAAPVRHRFTAAGLPAPAGIGAGGLSADPGSWPFLCERQAVLAAAPLISVVIATRDRADQLARALGQLNGQHYPRFEAIVVENVPTGAAVRQLTAAQPAHIPYRYLAEPRSGLSWARNTGIAAATGQIVTFLDDDAEPDPYWLASLATGFARSPDVGCVTGIILPAVLDTLAQELFEQLGGHSKGRAFEKMTFTRHGPQSPCFPLPAFGAGANMAFRRQTLEKIGGMDVALGAGTPTLGGADTLALTLTLLSGYHIAYEPAALMRHHHRRDLPSLDKQLYGYSVGLTAYYTALLRHHPSAIRHVLAALPHAAHYLRTAAKDAPADTARPLAAVDKRNRHGMLTGPLAYARSSRIQNRARRAFTNS